MKKASLRIKSNTRQVADRLKRASSKAVRDALLQVEREAAQRAPVDTGSLRASIYIQWFGRGEATISGRQPPKGQARFGEAPSVPTGALSGFAAVGVEYGYYVHEGHLAVRLNGSTRDRKAGRTAMRISDQAAGTWVPPRPFLRQGGEAVARRFLTEILPTYMAEAGFGSRKP